MLNGRRGKALGSCRSSRAEHGELARAKINLSLHVVGRRADGLHALDSLVAFAGLGDVVSVRWRPAGVSLQLDRNTPFADLVPEGEDNLALRAACCLAELAHPGVGAEIHLEKRLPVGAGLGGGSADAAAVLLALRRIWGIEVADEVIQRIAFGLGADVPACVVGRSARVRGAGERIDLVRLPRFWCVLVWPGYAISTAAAFRAFAASGTLGDGLPAMPDRFEDPGSLAVWLRGCRNDLQCAAAAIAPGLGAVRESLEEAGALHASMSGSGSAHWGMFAGEEEARRAVTQIRSARPGWWCKAVVAGEDGDPAPLH